MFRVMSLSHVELAIFHLAEYKLKLGYSFVLFYFKLKTKIKYDISINTFHSTDLMKHIELINETLGNFTEVIYN